MSAPRVFVSHSHKDDALTTRLVADLRAAGVVVWVDVADMQHGDFMQRINEALTQCEWLVLVQTPNSLASPAVRTEVGAALNLVWQQRMRDVIPFIAAPCDPRDVPPMWSTLHHYDATIDGYEAAVAKLARALGIASPGIVTSPPAQAAPHAPPPPVVSAAPDLPGVASRQLLPRRLTELSFAARAVNGVEVVVPPLRAAPAGDFIMGSDVTRDKDAQVSETPQYLTPIERAYQIGAYPVTVAEYACAVRAKAVREPQKYGNVDWAAQQARLDHPVVRVSWNDAVAYIAWLAKTTGQPWRLPTEAEWEKAARGADGRIYPWGDTWDARRANTSDGGPKTTTPVGAYADKGDASPYECHDMAGDVWEWCSSLYQSYPYKADDGRENLDSTKSRVLRGGSWLITPRYARAACRDGDDPVNLGYYRGFRLARGAGAGSS